MLSFLRPCDLFEEVHLSPEPMDVSLLSQEPVAGLFIINKFVNSLWLLQPIKLRSTRHLFVIVFAFL